MRARIRGWRLPQHSPLPLEDIARSLSPVLRGWDQYYGRFYPTELRRLYEYFDERLGAWLRCKYKQLKGHRGRSLLPRGEQDGSGASTMMRGLRRARDAGRA
ncbi:hypothetical protein LPJ38_35825 [Bradyrhizobium daqingense]|nr:group II intron maturase-specific domain-containing protein [Bradyrhizobium daqingense]UFS88912.1 hypothetical protein LPJ38_35825 [Bradyrhizobium daqingense]